MDSRPLFGGIEAGGTKFNCIVASDPDHVVAQTRIPTTSPEITLTAVIDFFRPYASSDQISILGVGAFGPVDLEPRSPTYGFITATPKPGWRNFDLVGALFAGLHLEVVLDTDVNAAALAEATWGSGRGLDSTLYLTIGTGIGGGFTQRGQLLHGLTHPEMGHIRVPHERHVDPFPGNCPFHGDCFEGLANGPAIEKRLGRSAESLPDTDPFWEIEAGYIAAALADYILILSPARIILGGGIMQRRFMFGDIRKKVLQALNGYIQSAAILDHIDAYIVPPGLGNFSGMLGALALAKNPQPGPVSR